MFSFSSFQDEQIWINNLKQELNNDDISRIDQFYNEYKTVKSNLKNLLKYFTKFGLLAEFYELFNIFQNDKKINDYMLFEYQLLPFIINDQIHQPLITEFSVSDDDKNLLLEIGQKLNIVFSDLNAELTAIQLIPKDIYQNNLKRIMYKDNGDKIITELNYSQCYQFFQKYYQQFEQKYYHLLFVYYSILLQTNKRLKQFFKFEKTLTKVLMNDTKQLTEKQIKILQQFNQHPRLQEFITSFNEKIQTILMLKKFESESFKNFVSKGHLWNKLKFPNEPYSTSLTKQSSDKNYEIQTNGDDYKINLILKSRKQKENIEELQFQNFGLFQIGFCENNNYFYILQSFNFQVISINPFKQILNFTIDLNYMEERFVNVQFYCNDQKLILISDLQLYFIVLQNEQFKLEKIVSIKKITKSNLIQIIQLKDPKDYQIEIISKTSLNNFVYCLIQENTGELIKYYVI